MMPVTCQMQDSYATIPLRYLSWSKGIKLKQHLTTLHMAGRADRCFSVRRNLRLSIGACVGGHKVKFLKISAFKGNAKNDESGSNANGSKLPKNSVKLSYVPQENGETVLESSKVRGAPVSYTSESNGGMIESSAIHKLFKKWLNMLRTRSPPSEVADGILSEGSLPSDALTQTQDTTENQEKVEILKAAWCKFLGLDAAIKLPLLMFIPLYLVVNMIYGAEVSKELTPLWILGPLIVAFYIKMLRGLWALYVFSFKQTVKVIKNLPTYCLVTYSYVADGKLKEGVRSWVLQPVVNIRNLDYKELSKKKMKRLEEWVMDKYLDFVESIWPYYCRTIRFLKRANLI